MPLWDFVCKECGNKIDDRYFPTYAAAEIPVVCAECGTEMEKAVPLFQYESFKPFTTRNIRRDGKPVHITSKNQWMQVMRENHVVPHPHNDTVEAKADPREIGRAVAEDRKKFPARYRKLKEEVRAITSEAVAPAAQRAEATRFGTRNA